jgi:hypothetical protein
MKKILIAGAAVLVVLAALSAAGLAYARSQTPPPPYGVGRGGMMGAGYGAGMMGGRGMMGGAGTGMMGSSTYGSMHTYMVAALAEELGLTVEDVQSRIEAGETPYQIAQAQGLTDEQTVDLMERAHDAALAAAVAAGALTQAQADWMDQHMEQMWQNGGAGFGPCRGGTAGAGAGMGWRWNQQPAQPTN